MSIPASILGDKYEVVRLIREGGMGKVFLVRHRHLDDFRVIKLMREQFASDPELRQRFLREARTASRMKHPHIAPIYDFSVADDATACIVMEFIEGRSLIQLLREEGPPPVEQTLEICDQVLEALDYLHGQGYIHRDISPDNIMLSRDHRGRPLVKLIDLGIAKRIDQEATRRLTRTGAFLGKVFYAAPEQFDHGELDQRSDVYSFAVVIYELLTGVCPIQGTTISQVIKAHLLDPPRDFTSTDPQGRVPHGLRNVVLKALAKKPEDRYASASEFADHLRRSLEVSALETDPTIALADAPTRLLAPTPAEPLNTATLPDAPAIPDAPTIADAGSASDATVPTAPVPAATASAATAPTASASAPPVPAPVEIPTTVIDLPEKGGKATPWAGKTTPLTAATIILLVLLGVGFRSIFRSDSQESTPPESTALTQLADQAENPPGVDSSTENETTSTETQTAETQTAEAQEKTAETETPENDSTSDPASTNFETKAPDQAPAPQEPAAGASSPENIAKAAPPRPTPRRKRPPKQPPRRPANAGATATSSGSSSSMSLKLNSPADAAAASAADSTVTVHPPPLAGTSVEIAGAGFSGTYTLQQTLRLDLAPGRYRLVFRAPDGLERERTIRLGEREDMTVQAPADFYRKEASQAAFQRGDLIKPSDPDVVPPKRITNPPLGYPREASEAHLGEVVRVAVAVLVDENGAVIDSNIEHSTYPTLGFNETALWSASQAKFQPATRAGVPGKMWTKMNFTFNPPKP